MGTRQYVQHFLVAAAATTTTTGIAVIAVASTVVEERRVLRDDSLDQMEEFGITLQYVTTTATATTGNWRVGARRRARRRASPAYWYRCGHLSVWCKAGNLQLQNEAATKQVVCFDEIWQQIKQIR